MDKILAEIAGINKGKFGLYTASGIKHEVFFRVPAAIDGCLADSGAIGNGLDTHGIKAFVCEEFEGGIQDSFVGFGATRASSLAGEQVSSTLQRLVRVIRLGGIL